MMGFVDRYTPPPESDAGRRTREAVKWTQCAPGKMLFGEELRIPQLRASRVMNNAAAGANLPERWTHSNQGEHGPLRTRRTALKSPVFESASGEQGSTPHTAFTPRIRASPSWGQPRESKAQSLSTATRGGCSESKAQSYAACPGFGGLESSTFLGMKAW